MASPLQRLWEIGAEEEYLFEVTSQLLRFPIVRKDPFGLRAYCEGVVVFTIPAKRSRGCLEFLKLLKQVRGFRDDFLCFPLEPSSFLERPPETDHIPISLFLGRREKGLFIRSSFFVGSPLFHFPSNSFLFPLSLKTLFLFLFAPLLAVAFFDPIRPTGRVRFVLDLEEGLELN